jgi:hypothetical protein
MVRITNANAAAKAKKAAQMKSSNVPIKVEGLRKRKSVEASDVEIEEDDEGSPSKVLS